MADTYTTRQSETVDLACFNHYGRTAAVTEAVLVANPGIAGRGLVLPMGTVLVMPATAAPKARKLVSLWD